MNYLSDLANCLKPYVAGEQPQDKKYIKLNTNENPYPPSKLAEEVYRDISVSDLRLYPDPSSRLLTDAISKAVGVKRENVFVGNGSDEVLAHVFRAFFNPFSRPVAFADITYSFYEVYAKAFNVNYKIIPLNERFEITIDDYMSLGDCQGILIANPNAPTGIALMRSEIEAIAAANLDKVVIIDEAYVDFCNESVLSLTSKYENLVVVQTMSKSYSLAGMRCGYAVANENLIAGLNKIKDSFNSYPIDRVCERVAAAAIADREYLLNTVNMIIDAREYLTVKLRELGFSVLPSSANFIFAGEAKVDANTIYEKLKDRGILVRYFNKPRISDYLRITIGTMREMTVLLREIANIIEE